MNWLPFKGNRDPVYFAPMNLSYMKGSSSRNEFRWNWLHFDVYASNIWWKIALHNAHTFYTLPPERTQPKTMGVREGQNMAQNYPHITPYCSLFWPSLTPPVDPVNFFGSKWCVHVSRIYQYIISNFAPHNCKNCPWGVNECAATKEAIITALEVSHRRLTRPWKMKMAVMTMVVMPISMVSQWYWR